MRKVIVNFDTLTKIGKKFTRLDQKKKKKGMSLFRKCDDDVVYFSPEIRTVEKGRDLR